jgi:hypothetical protein
MSRPIVYLGMDVHKESVTIGAAGWQRHRRASIRLFARRVQAGWDHRTQGLLRLRLDLQSPAAPCSTRRTRHRPLLSQKINVLLVA